MGWINYIIVPSLKLMVVTSRYTDGICDYEMNAINELLDDKHHDDIVCDIGNTKVSDITVKDLTILYDKYEILSSFEDVNADKLFIYWLTSRNIKFEIVAGHNIDIEKYMKDGYTKIDM